MLPVLLLLGRGGEPAAWEADGPLSVEGRLQAMGAPLGGALVAALAGEVLGRARTDATGRCRPGMAALVS